MSGPSIQERIAQIRSASFTASRKGYDRDEVDRYLAAIADWLVELGLDEPDHGGLRRELAWVGERTSEILTKAEETARELSAQGAADAERIREEARADADRMLAEAEDEVRRTEARRRDLQILIGDLIERRDEIIADGNRLVDELSDLFAIEDEDEPQDEPEDEPEPIEDFEAEDLELGPEETL